MLKLLATIDAKLKVLFCNAEKFWMSRFVDNEKDLLVRMINSYASQCKYCTNIRSIMLGASLFAPIWLGIILSLLVVLFVYGERRWMCGAE